MDSTAAPTDVARLRVTRRFQASPARVYRAWTEPELMMRWFAEVDDDMRIVALDLRVGGRYRFEGEHDGHTWVLEGEFLEVRPAERLVYTWKWETDKNLGGPRRHGRHGRLPRVRRRDGARRHAGRLRERDRLARALERLGGLPGSPGPTPVATGRNAERKRRRA
jgi:uncharacterized protein YndB with AHSA1/START domain